MVQIGAASASAIGKRLGIAPRHMRTIVACGAAGGLAAVFNAPVGGAMFALEVITGELTPAFGAVILAAVSATVVSRSLFGNYPSFVVPKYDLVSNSELGFYVLFGLIAGLVGVALHPRAVQPRGPLRGSGSSRRSLKPVIGGLMVGIIARFRPEVLGEGAGAIEAATWGAPGADGALRAGAPQDPVDVRSRSPRAGRAASSAPRCTSARCSAARSAGWSTRCSRRPRRAAGPTRWSASARCWAARRSRRSPRSSCCSR